MEDYLEFCVLELCVCAAQGSPVLLAVPFQSIQDFHFQTYLIMQVNTSKRKSVLFVCSFSTYLKVILHSKITILSIQINLYKFVV